jgi:hypothetical protein
VTARTATFFIYLHLGTMVSIMVSALHWFPADYRRKRGLQTCPNAAMATAAKMLAQRRLTRTDEE